ncbi:MAG TPA: tRNA uracil 4-sulfurtransferase ThiI [Pseudidiomarina sp.]|nr:tRNA uracil 4-sulfurtransferase ThiI [Pseudidiomarina sp.]
MKFIIRLHAEITIKSKGVRKRYGKVLVNNLKSILRQQQLPVTVKWCWDRIELVIAKDALQGQEQESVMEARVLELLRDVPGIAWFSQSYEQPLSDLAAIAELTVATWGADITDRSFAVRVNRKGEHHFSSQDVAKLVGSKLLTAAPSARVNLTQPEVEVRIEIDRDTVRVFGHKLTGLGGFPLPTQETVVSLLSGGFDSSVASFQLLRRGARTHFCFFNLGGAQHETGVRQTAHYLWQRYASSHPLKFVSIDFAPIVEEIIEHVDTGLMGVVLKRQMLRAAEIVADRLNVSALVTGEALGQVSSQTLSNLSVIDEATNKLVLRPLITMDKQEIINIAQQIGTADLARSMPEYCGVISVKPNVKAATQAVLEAEAKLDVRFIERQVLAANVVEVSSLGEQLASQVQAVNTVDSVPANAEVIDIRSADQQEVKPLNEHEVGAPVHHIPFFKLARRFAELDRQKTYLLYCEQGVMSQLQALYLQEQGYSNVAVLKVQLYS